jgi:hypothetical protein
MVRRPERPPDAKASDKIKLHRNISSNLKYPFLQLLLMSLRPLARSTWRLRVPRRHYATPPKPPPFPTTPTCPNPTCTCSEMPELPPLMSIDYKTALNGTMAPYAEQVLICTGQEDWSSKIEEENSGDNLAADLKELLGRGGAYADVCLPIRHDRRVLLMIGSRIIMSLLRIPRFLRQSREGKRYRIHPHTCFRRSNTSHSCRECLSIPFKRW